MKAVAVAVAVAAAAGALGAARAPLGAQEPVATLTLEEALRLGRERNPGYLRAVAREAASGAAVRAGYGAFLPSLSGNLSVSGATQTILTGEDFFGQPVQLDTALTFKSSYSSQGLSSSLTLFDGLQNLHNLRAARAGREAAAAAVDVAGFSLEAEIARRFYDAVQARRVIEVEEQLLAVSRQQLAATERLFRVAARTEVDVLGAQVQVAQQEQALEQARGDARKATLQLAEVIGLTEPVAFEVVGELPAPFDPGMLDPDTLVAHARWASPGLAEAQATAREARFSASAARARRWPTVTARASFGRNMSLSSYDALFELNPQNRTFGFGLDLQLPIFTRFQTSQAVAQATANQRVAEESLREQELQLERYVRSAVIDLNTAYRRVQLAQRAGELSRRRLTMAQEQYQLGTIGFTDFQQIVTQTSSDARRLRSAELEFARALVTLEELVGEKVR